MTNIGELPEGCVSHILSLTSPVDVLRSSLVSKQFLSASEYDTVWRNFLPSDCVDIISKSSAPIRRDQFSSKKEFFSTLVRFPLLLDNRTKSFALDKWSGKKCYMLGARALTIIWDGTPEYWSWASVPNSRFPECALLRDVCWLEIIGKIDTTLLSPTTTYGAYFVFKMNTDRKCRRTGFEHTPVKASVSEISEDGLARDEHEIKKFFLRVPGSATSKSALPEENAVVRDDGWMEIEMGRYRVGRVHDADERKVLEMSLREVEAGHWKKGLVVHGIEVRPLRS